MAEATAQLLQQRFSAERLGTYQASVGGDLDATVALYEWNATMSGAFWITLGHVEVLIRNAMHRQLTDWSTRLYQEPRWYLDPGRVLDERRHQQVAKAREQATRDGRQETPGRVVAELTFGFWPFLLTRAYDRSLWPYLRGAWPSKRLRRDVHGPMADLHELRNRIGHHEPIYNRPLKELHTKALNLAGWTCSDTGAWIASRCQVLAVLDTRPWTVRASHAPPQRRGQHRPTRR
ncbi:hypothetical protein [Plantactinospora sp. GCM10030261]|uniref:hypothetical protein n=1 Tax=Plantactinospora sp. GCM10030261 TaxID=3273420 RepID=UPI00360C9D5C